VKPRLDRSGAAGERAQARASEATRASHSTWHPDEGRPLWLGSCFGRVSVSAGGCRLPTFASECACPHGWARDGARDRQSRFRRFDRSCSWTVLIAEVDERRLACYRMVTGLVSPLWRGERAPEAGSRRQSRDSGGGFPVMSAQAGGGSTRRWKALWPVEAVVFDETAVEAGLASGEGRHGESQAGGCRVRQGRQRLRRQLGSRSKTPWPGDTAGGAVDRGTRQDRAVSRSRAMQGVIPGYRVARRCASRAEAGGSPSSDAPPRWRAAQAAGQRTKGAARPTEAQPGIERFAGCSCRRSVADIGETHLLRKRRVGPQGSLRGRRGSLKRPPRLLTGPGRIAASERVRGWNVQV
jgi:hypothetical protein